MNETKQSDVQRQLVCESCGASFTCYPVPGACWCSEVRLTDAARAQLKEEYTQCLCPDCLGKRASREQGRSA